MSSPMAQLENLALLFVTHSYSRCPARTPPLRPFPVASALSPPPHRPPVGDTDLLHPSSSLPLLRASQPPLNYTRPHLHSRAAILVHVSAVPAVEEDGGGRVPRGEFQVSIQSSSRPVPPPTGFLGEQELPPSSPPPHCPVASAAAGGGSGGHHEARRERLALPHQGRLPRPHRG
jgi:hypothetical protein